MAAWSQDYDPLHSWPLSTLVAALPVLTLFFVLLVLRARVWVAAMAGAMAAVVLDLVAFGMPATLVGGAFTLGIQFGLWRIAWIIVARLLPVHLEAPCACYSRSASPQLVA
jgi:lactate permease